MHVLGKVFAFFLIPVLAIAAIFLTTMTLDVRTHWEEQIGQARAEYAEIEADLAIKRANARDAQESTSVSAVDDAASQASAAATTWRRSPPIRASSVDSRRTSWASSAELRSPTPTQPVTHPR